MGRSVVAPGSVAVVTGSTRGFGRVLAERLARRGVIVVISGPDAAESAAYASELEAQGLRAHASVGDVTSEADVASLVAAARELGRLDLWVNNAAYESPGMSPVTAMPADVFEAIQQVNVLGTYRCTRHALGAMADGGGVVVNVTGRGDDLRPAKFTAAYSASKAWIRSFTRSVAAEVAGTNVRVIAFNPGIMTTHRMDVQDELTDVAVDERTRKLFDVVTRVLGDPPDVAADALVAFLDADPASLKKELRLITPVRVAKGLGGEAQRAGSELLTRTHRRVTA
jgi:NAD(P)-dependent dehydrogenase (short-subunit alcohol dehydrogenase family)